MSRRLVTYRHLSQNLALSASPNLSFAGWFRVEQNSFGTKVGQIWADGSMALCVVLRVRSMEYEIVDAARTIKLGRQPQAIFAKLLRSPPNYAGAAASLALVLV